MRTPGLSEIGSKNTQFMPIALASKGIEKDEYFQAGGRIAAKTGVAMLLMGVLMNMLGQKVKCEHCGMEFELMRLKQRFCSASCRSKHWDTIHPRIQVDRPFLEVVREISAGAKGPG
jgi:hypothetical protein